MTALTIHTSKVNRQLLALAFGQNQTAIRFLESMAQDITVNIPDAINGSGSAQAIQFLQMSVNQQVPVPRITDPFARMAFESVAARQPDSNGIIARLESASFVGQAPGNYLKQQAFVSFQQASTAGTSLTSGTPANVASIALAAGTWDLSGSIVFNAAATTVTQQIAGGVSTTSGVLGTPDTQTKFQESITGGSYNTPVPLTRIVLANAATVYLVAQATFTTSTMTVDGYIKARPAL